MRRSPAPLGARLIFGLVLLTLGVLWTLDNTGLVDGDSVIRWWPFVLILLGVLRLTGVGMARRPVAGAVFLFLGIAFAVDSLGILRWDLFDMWPVMLILLGGMIVWKSLRGPGSGRGPIEVHVIGADRISDAGGHPGADTFSCVAVWSGVDRKSTSQSLKGGDFTAVMGGGELDLRHAKPVPEGAEIEVLVIMGGLEVYVPEDWTVINDVTAVMGAVEDSRKIGVPPSDRTLVLKGFVMMGGVEIKT